MTTPFDYYSTFSVSFCSSEESGIDEMHACKVNPDGYRKATGLKSHARRTAETRCENPEA